MIPVFPKGYTEKDGPWPPEDPALAAAQQRIEELEAETKELRRAGKRQLEEWHGRVERLEAVGNRLAVLAQEHEDKLMEVVGSVDGFRIIEKWWEVARAAAESGEGDTRS